MILRVKDPTDAASWSDFLSIYRPVVVRMACGLGLQHADADDLAQQVFLSVAKPANIFLDQNVERVQLMDFGLARAVDDASLTRSGTLAGTPQYMSPEQARAETVDHRSDLFSLGSVKYAMCTGHAPYVNDPAKPTRALATSVAAKLDEEHKNPDGRRDGFLVFTLEFTDDKWLVIDIDFETDSGAEKELKRFLKANPNSIGLPPLTSNSMPNPNPAAVRTESPSKK